MLVYKIWERIHPILQRTHLRSRLDLQFLASRTKLVSRVFFLLNRIRFSKRKPTIKHQSILKRMFSSNKWLTLWRKKLVISWRKRRPKDRKSNLIPTDALEETKLCTNLLLEESFTQSIAAMCQEKLVFQDLPWRRPLSTVLVLALAARITPDTPTNSKKWRKNFMMTNPLKPVWD